MATTIGRQEELDELLEKLDRFYSKKKKQHFVYIAPRGVGKTHFLRLLEIRISRDGNLTEKFIILRFPEENHRLLSFADFLLGIADILSEKIKHEQLKNAHAELEVETNDQKICDTLIPLINSICKTQRKNLIVILENIDVVLGQQMKNEQSIHAMRKYLMETEHLIFIGASPSYFAGFDDLKHPFFGFFDTLILPELTQSQTVELIRRNLEFDEKKELLADFEELIPKIQALYEMTGGNCRLLMILYNLIAEENILDVIRQFQELLDRISPFYQDRIKDLAPQERALIENMALMRSEYKTPNAIAAKLRKTPQQTSSILKRLLKVGYLIQSSHPNDKRSKIYRIKEGFFDLWLAMSQSRNHNKYIPYLVDFFAIWYANEKSREEKRQNLKFFIQKESTQLDNHNDSCQETILDYLTEIGDPIERNESKLDLTSFYLSIGQIDRANTIFSEITIQNEMLKHHVWLTNQTKNWLLSGKPPEIVEQIKDMIQCWKDFRTGDLEAFASKAFQLGVDLTEKGLHEVNIAFINEKIEKVSISQMKMQLLESLGNSLDKVGQYEKALEAYRSAFQTATGINAKPNVLVRLLHYIGSTYLLLKDYKSALSSFESSLDLDKQNKDSFSEASTLNSISAVYLAENQYSKALQYANKSLKIRQEIGDKSGLSATLFNLAFIHGKKDEILLSVKALVHSYRFAKSADIDHFLKMMGGIKHKFGSQSELLNEFEMLSKNIGKYESGVG
ncbi:MAG: tetratricopeptide repeat protein [Proteobacteria bacterium]|nr:tetratricopeptide repeat protein [Pseudomonadota bacterium]